MSSSTYRSSAGAGRVDGRGGGEQVDPEQTAVIRYPGAAPSRVPEISPWVPLLIGVVVWVAIVGVAVTVLAGIFRVLVG